MPPLLNPDRVRFWNALFGKASAEASVIAQRSGKAQKRNHRPKLQLSDDETSRLILLIYCTLAIEARANHLIDELVERGRLSESESTAVQRLSAEAKWFMLPKLAGVRKRLDPARPPHQAIVELCALRNALFHVNFKRIQDRLPPAGKMLSLFSGFVAAMEDLNVVLGRSTRPRRAVLELGDFQ